MATILFAAIGTAIGASIGGSIGGTIGGIAAATIGSTIGGIVGSGIGNFIDQAFVFPAIFGKGSSTLYGPKISDVQLTTSSPGSPLNKCFGRQNRLPGTVIWMSPLQQHTVDTEIGGGGGGMFGKGGGGQTLESFKYTISIAVAVCEGPINGVRKIWADGQLVFDDGVVDKRITGITFYAGTPDQEPDPLIQSFEGSDKVPGFVNTAYIMIQDFNVGDWGNRVPNFTFLVEEREQALLADVIEGIWLRSGRNLAEVDVSYVADVEVVGYNISGPQSAIKMLEPLLLTYDVIAQEINGVVHFRHRRDSNVALVTGASLAAYEDGTSDTTRVLKISDAPGFDLPDIVTVNYIDPVFAWQKQSQSANRFASPAPTTQVIEVPIVMSGDNAKALAQRIMWCAWAERGDVEFTMTPSQLHILESDLVRVTTGDDYSLDVRVTNIKQGNNFVIEVQGSTEQASALVQTAVADIPIVPVDPSPLTPRIHDLVIMEIPVLPFNDRGTYYTWAVCRSAPGDPWKAGTKLEAVGQGQGCQSLSAPDGYVVNTTYGARAEGTIGVCQETLPATGPIGYFDHVTTLTLTMINGELVPVIDGTTYKGFWNAVTNTPTLVSGTGTQGDYYRIPVGKGSTTQTLDGTSIWLGGDIVYFDGTEWQNLGDITPETSLDVFSGKNLMYIGRSDGTGEVIQFHNAQLVAQNTYVISKLLRGRMGTEDRMVGHGSGEYAVLLNANNQVHTWDYAKGFGTTHYHKALSNGQKLRAAIEVPAVKAARSITPFSPVQIKGVQDPLTGDLAIRWIRRTDGWESMFGGATSKPSDYKTAYARELYDVEIYQVGGTDPVRTLRAGATGTGPIPNLPSVLYTSSQQAADALGFNGYATLIASGAFAYWRMDTISGSPVVLNALGSGDLGLTGTYTLGTAGLLFGDASTSIEFTDADAVATLTWASPTAYTFEALLKPYWASGILGYNPTVAMLTTTGGTMVWEIQMDETYANIGVHNQYGNYNAAVSGLAQDVPFLLTVAFGTSPAYAPRLLETIPTVYLRLGESSGTAAADASGNGHNGTYTGGFTLGTAGLLTGDADTGVTLNGSSGTVLLADDPAWDNTTVSFGCWFKTSASGVTQNLIRRDTGASRHFLMKVNSSGKLENFGIFGAGFGVISTASVNDGLKHFGVTTITRSGSLTTIALYLDGALVGTATDSVPMPSGNAPIYVGCLDGSSEFFNGEIDEVFFTAGRTMGAGEVLALFNNHGAAPGGRATVSINGAVQGHFDMASFDAVPGSVKFHLGVGSEFGGNPFIGLVDEVSLFASELGPSPIAEHNASATTLVLGAMEVIVYQINPALRPYNQGRGVPSARTRL